MGDWKSLLHSAIHAIWRRRWIALSVAWGVCLVGWVGVALIPNAYKARTRIYVDTDTMLSPLLKGMTVEMDLMRQLEVMQRTLLSRPNIEKVLASNDLDRNATTPEKREALVEMMEKKTSMRPEASRNLFSIEYIDSDPEMARKVLQSFLTIFIESNIGTQRKDMEQAQNFISGQVAQYEQQLKESEARLAEFKEKYRDVLPGTLGGEGTFGTLLAKARDQVVATRRELDDMTTRRAAVARQLASIPRFLDVTQRNAQFMGMPSPGGGVATKIQEAEERLAMLRTRYTEQHPDVIGARRILEQLKKQRDASPESVAGSQGPTERISNPVYEQLQLRHSEIDTTVEALHRRLGMEMKEVEKLDSMSQTIPKIEAEYADLTRDYGMIKKNYTELLARQESAKLSQAVDSKTDKVSFRVVEPPVTPVKPSFPNRLLLACGVFVAGIGAGLAVAFGLYQLDDSFTSVKAVRAALPYPVIGAVSRVDSPQSRRMSRSGKVKFAFACACLALTFGTVTMLMTANIGAEQLARYQRLLQDQVR